jgi:hypothetical protein
MTLRQVVSRVRTRHTQRRIELALAPGLLPHPAHTIQAAKDAKMGEEKKNNPISLVFLGGLAVRICFAFVRDVATIRGRK